MSDCLEIIYNRYIPIGKPEFYNIVAHPRPGLLLVFLSEHRMLHWAMKELAKHSVEFLKRSSGWMSKSNTPLIRIIHADLERLRGYPRGTKILMWDYE